MLELLSFLVNMAQVVGIILVVVVALFFGRVLLRRLGKGGEWVPYTRAITSGRGREELEVGVKRTRYLGLIEPTRMPLEAIPTKMVSDDPANLYQLQSRAQETAASLNARSDHSDY